MFVRRSIRPLRNCEKNTEKEIYQKKNITKSLYFTYALEHLIQPIAMEVCTFVKVTNVVNLASFGGCVLMGLVCVKSRFFSCRKLTWPLQQSFALPR
jgi:hypothetical protein